MFTFNVYKVPTKAVKTSVDPVAEVKQPEAPLVAPVVDQPIEVVETVEAPKTTKAKSTKK